MYTDGLTDALASDGRSFDPEQFRTLLQSYADLSPDELCRAIFADLVDFQGVVGQYDDMTMLVVDVR